MDELLLSLSVDATAISLISVTVSVATLLISVFKIAAGQNDRITKLEECTKDLKKIKDDIEALKDDVQMLLTHDKTLWNYIDGNIGKVLHSPHTPEIDALLEKMPPFSVKPLLSLFEAEKLKCLLLPDWQKEKDKVKKDAYGLYLARLDLLIMEKKGEILTRGR